MTKPDFMTKVPGRTADNNDLFLLDECRIYARTMVKKLQALDQPDVATAVFIEVMEAVEKGLEADTELRISWEEL